MNNTKQHNIILEYEKRAEEIRSLRQQISSLQDDQLGDLVEYID